MSPDRRVVLINLKKDSRGSLGTVHGYHIFPLLYGDFYQVDGSVIILSKNLYILVDTFLILSLGLTVVGGEDTQRLHYGIFIKKITSGSVAEQDGRLKTGKTVRISSCINLLFFVSFMISHS